MTEFCFIQLKGWTRWWHDIYNGSARTLAILILFFLPAILPYPLARNIFLLLERIAPDKWTWPKEARKFMMWQTVLLVRASLFWIVLKISQLSLFLCQWPSWIFGICLIIYIDSVSNVLREVIVRKGLVGYHEGVTKGREVMLREGSTIVFLVLLIYTNYLDALVGTNEYLRVACSIGFSSALILPFIPILRNLIGAHYMLLNDILTYGTWVRVHTVKKWGSVDKPILGYIVLKSNLSGNAKTYLPASLLICKATVLQPVTARPMRLEVNLPSVLKTGKVRSFIQELDELLEDWSRPWSIFAEDEQSTQIINACNDNKSNTFYSMRIRGKGSEVDSVVDRARGRRFYIILDPRRKWRVCIQVYLIPGNDSDFMLTREKCIRLIASLQERGGYL